MKWISRGQWDARQPSQALTRISLPVGRVYIHHTETPEGPDPAAIWRNVQRYHMDTRGYSDIAYEAGVARDGTIYEGRVAWAVGAHTLNHNRDGHAICFIGNYEDEPLSDAQINAARELIAAWQGQGVVVREPVIMGHRDVFATACPGNAAYAQLDRIRAPWTGPTEPPPTARNYNMSGIRTAVPRAKLPNGQPGPGRFVSVWLEGPRTIASSGRIVIPGTNTDAANYDSRRNLFILNWPGERGDLEFLQATGPSTWVAVASDGGDFDYQSLA